MDETMTRGLVLKALKQAVGRKRPSVGLIPSLRPGQAVCPFTVPNFSGQGQ